MKLTFGYSDSDDRMWLRAGNGEILWWLTRRLALRIVRELAALIEKTARIDAPDDAADGAPPSPARASAARHLAAQEFRSAIARKEPNPAAGADADAARGAPPEGVLLFSVDLAADTDRVVLTLSSTAKRQRIGMQRDDAYRVLNALVSRCRRNGWLDNRLPDWIEVNTSQAAKRFTLQAMVTRTPPTGASPPDEPPSRSGNPPDSRKPD